MEKVLVTGTAGFIGSHLAHLLNKEGYEVVGLDQINDYYDINLKYDRLTRQGIVKEEITYGKVIKGKENISFVQLNLEDNEGVKGLFEDQQFDYVVNLAAQAGVRYSIENPKAYIDSNIVGFTNILESCRAIKVKHLVYASSSSVYGLDKAFPFKESAHTDHPMSLYAATKKSNEMMAHVYSHLFEIPTSGLRFFTVYGPWGRPDMALFLFTDAILNGRPINVFNEGKMMRDFTYVDDIVNGVLGVLRAVPEGDASFDAHNPNPAISSAPFRLYNIGNNSPVNLMDFISAIEDKLGIKAEKNLMPMQPGDVSETYANAETLINNTGHKPDTTIDYGIGKFIDWYQSYYQK
jgi:UDP-glucuronate 4-epimerase